MRRVAKEYQVSVKTVHKWYHKPRKQYISPKGQPALKLTSELRQFIEVEKHRANPGPKKLSLMIVRRYGIRISSTVIYRFLKKKGLIKRPQKRLPWYTPLKEPIIPTYPGERIELDSKYIWHSGRRRYQRTFVDVYTGIPYAHIGDTKDDDLTIVAFKEAEAYFPFTMHGVQTDNGGEFRGTFHQYLTERGISHYFIPKKSPQWNGAVERFHRTIDEEYYQNHTQSFSTLEEYLYWFMYERIHLGKYVYGLTPYEKLLEYEASVTSRC